MTMDFISLVIKRNISKYKYSKNQLDIKIVDDLIFNEKKHIVTTFKEFLFLNDSCDFITHYFTLSEAFYTLKGFFDERREFTSYFPLITDFSQFELILKGKKRKEKYTEMVKNKVNSKELEYKQDKIFKSSIVSNSYLSISRNDNTLPLNSNGDKIIKGCKDFIDKDDLGFIKNLNQERVINRVINEKIKNNYRTIFNENLKKFMIKKERNFQRVPKVKNQQYIKEIFKKSNPIQNQKYINNIKKYDQNKRNYLKKQLFTENPFIIVNTYKKEDKKKQIFPQKKDKINIKAQTSILKSKLFYMNYCFTLEASPFPIYSRFIKSNFINPNKTLREASSLTKKMTNSKKSLNNRSLQKTQNTTTSNINNTVNSLAKKIKNGSLNINNLISTRNKFYNDNLSYHKNGFLTIQPNVNHNYNPKTLYSRNSFGSDSLLRNSFRKNFKEIIKNDDFISDEMFKKKIWMVRTKLFNLKIKNQKKENKTTEVRKENYKTTWKNELCLKRKFMINKNETFYAARNRTSGLK